MLLPHVARHQARYLGTWVVETGQRLALGRLTEDGPCLLWLDEGGVHFERSAGSAMLLPRRCLLRAETRRRGLGRVVDIWWRGAEDEIWISRFTAAAGIDWPAAVKGLRDGTAAWNAPPDGA